MAGPGTADAIVVLGTRVLAGGRPSAALRRRTEHGAALFRAGAAPRVVLTGGPGRHGAVEAEAMRALIVGMGVPAEALVLETAARSTFDNAVHTARLARAHGWRSLVVVTEGYHLPRALFVFRRTGLAVAGSAAPSGPSGRHRAAAHAAELVKWPWYLWRVAARDRARLRAARQA